MTKGRSQYRERPFNHPLANLPPSHPVPAAPFIARMVETSLSEVDAGVIEAAQSMGASTFQIVRKVYLPEAMPSLVLGGGLMFLQGTIDLIKTIARIAGKEGACEQ